eukprot:GHVU01045397.1.p1 GENE.GHVU01045397.1~~GHVU01045397.1.p1  ORF type:complete len:133 (+),score=10.52 GHVU01045397.1:1605-2003(+)
MFRIGNTQTSVVGVLDSGSVHSYMSVDTFRQLADAGELTNVEPLPDTPLVTPMVVIANGERRTMVSGLVKIDVRVSLADQTVMILRGVPFRILEDAFDYVSIGQAEYSLRNHEQMEIVDFGPNGGVVDNGRD